MTIRKQRNRIGPTIDQLYAASIGTDADWDRMRTWWLHPELTEVIRNGVVRVHNRLNDTHAMLPAYRGHRVRYSLGWPIEEEAS